MAPDPLGHISEYPDKKTFVLVLDMSGPSYFAWNRAGQTFLQQPRSRHFADWSRGQPLSAPRQALLTNVEAATGRKVSATLNEDQDEDMSIVGDCRAISRAHRSQRKYVVDELIDFCRGPGR